MLLAPQRLMLMTSHSAVSPVSDLSAGLGLLAHWEDHRVNLQFAVPGAAWEPPCGDSWVWQDLLLQDPLPAWLLPPSHQAQGPRESPLATAASSMEVTSSVSTLDMAEVCVVLGGTVPLTLSYARSCPWLQLAGSHHT